MPALDRIADSVARALARDPHAEALAKGPLQTVQRYSVGDEVALALEFGPRGHVHDELNWNHV